MRYLIRVYESKAGDGSIATGAIVKPAESKNFSVYCETAEEAQVRIMFDIRAGLRATSVVYQICPTIGNPELTRSIAVAEDGMVDFVFLDPADGLYTELRKIRPARVAPLHVEDAMAPKAG